ncbi:MAG: PD-(D/E)XK nuclease family protein, partial [Myxococcales bacterium]|nr:PD-(D/E)XK nuclease family protein [Myxococcales bacterium]
MRLEIRASDLKDWFQYRCERKFIYATLPREIRDSIPVDEINDSGIRGDEGIHFEQNVLTRLIERGESVLRPKPHSYHVSPELTSAFLRGEHPAQFIYQAKLDETQSLRADLHLPANVSIRTGLPDLIEWIEEGGERRLRVIDVKHTRRPTQYHRAQVAFYALMLRGVFNSLGESNPPLHRKANIWYIGGGDQLWENERGLFDLRSYEELLRDFFRRQLPGMTSKTVERGSDPTFFHLYFKCEQCQWLQHCSKTIGDNLHPEEWDISAIPGLSHQSKSFLHRNGLRTVGSIARASQLGDGTWTLRTRGKLLKERGEAILSNQWSRLAEHHTWLMPPKIDVPIFLVVDRDPVANHLVSVGCLVGGIRAKPPTVEVITQANDELPALSRVLTSL